MAAEHHCPQCGAVLPADAFKGLCLKCLLSLGMNLSETTSDGKNLEQEGALESGPGEELGHYKLLQKIGEGGCGIVYMAEQKEPIRRPVALKVIKLGMDTQSVIARFEAERQALAMMDHPNIAKVLDAGAAETGRPYFVMELVRGIKITDYCDQKLLSTRERLDLFGQVCRAIQHAHQKGIIHRDIKPSNILVTLHDGVPVPKVIDFGIAKATQGRLTDHTLFTAFEQFLGTPAYMSPEQAEMNALDIDTRSDIYSLGVLLYELLTGKTPFDANELLQAGFDEMRRTIREREPVRPSTRLSTMPGEELTSTARRRQSDPLKLIHAIRGDLDWIVMKCLEKDRTRRYETANGLAADLQRFLTHEPVVARPPTKMYLLQKGFHRNKLFFTAVGAVALALTLGVAVSTWQAVRAMAAKKEATDNLRNARQNLYGTDMNLAQQALDEGNTRRAIDLLERHRHQEDLPGFEWRYLYRLSRGNSLEKIQAGLTNTRASVTFSRDGTMLAIGGTPLVQLWDVTSHRLVDPLQGHQTPVGDLAFSPDGRVLASIDADCRVIFWDFESRTKLATFEAATASERLHPRGADQWLAFFPDGKVLATSAAGMLKFWDTATKRRSADLPQHDSAISAISVSADGRLFALGDATGRVELWDLKAQSRLSTLRGLFGRVNSIAFSPDGSTLAAGSFGNQPELWDVATQREIGNLVHEGTVESVAFAPNGKFLVTSGNDQSPKLWDLHTLRPVKLFKGHTDNVFSVTFSRDGKILATESADGTVRLWEASPGEEGIVLRHDAAVLTLAFSRDGRMLATGSEDGTLRLWDVATQQEMTPPFPRQQYWIWAVGFSPDGKRLASGSGVWHQPDVPGELKLWDIATRREVAPLNGHTSGIYSVHFTLDDKRLVSASNDQTVRVWDIGTRRELTSIPSGAVKPTWGYWAQPSPDGRRMLTWGTKIPSGITIWELHTGKRLSYLEAEVPAFSSDGRTLATLGGDGIQLWDMTAGEQPVSLSLASQGAEDARVFSSLDIYSLAFAPDGRRLATAGKDGTVRLWTTNNHEVLRLRGHSNMVWKVAFSPDGNILASASADRTVRLWRAADPQ